MKKFMRSAVYFSHNRKLTTRFYNANHIQSTSYKIRRLYNIVKLFRLTKKKNIYIVHPKKKKESPIDEQTLKLILMMFWGIKYDN